MNWLNKIRAFFLAGLLFMSTSASVSAIELIGAGATFPYPLYSKMFYMYWKKTGVKINYQAIGSGGGQRQLQKMTVDFGGSDAFVSDEALKKFPSKILHIPTCLGAVAITYKLPENPELKFTPHLLAQIFLGKITRWNDDRITEINPGLKLPDMNIVVVHRSEGSGTTFVFTDYLTKTSELWKEKVGRGKAVNWPVGLGSKGNPGVAGLIKFSPGTIGYLEYGYALLTDMPVAWLQNRAGRFIQPNPLSISLSAKVNIPDDTRITITDTKASDGYPISSFSWILVYQEQAYRGRSEEKAVTLASALWWMIHDAQQYAEPLHYAPLPVNAKKKAVNLIKQMSYEGRSLIK